MLTMFLPQMAKLMHREASSGAHCSAARHGVSREFFQKHFNMFSPENIHRSIFTQENNSNSLLVESGTFGFTHLMDLSPAEVAFLATGSFMERLLFSILRWDRQFLDGILDFLMEEIVCDPHYHDLDRGKVRAVTRMLLMPSRSETNVLRRRFATGPGDSPFEALVTSYPDRLLSNIKLLHSTYTFIPRARAPPVSGILKSYRFFIIEEYLFG